MKSIKSFLFFIYFFTVIYSCREKTIRPEISSYFTTILTLADRANSLGTEFVFSSTETTHFLLEKSMYLLKIDTNDKIYKIKIDSLNILYNNLIQNLDSISTSLNELKEVDKKINLKDNALDFLQKSKFFYESSHQINLRSFSDDSSNQDIELLNLSLAQQNLNNSSNNYIKSASEFQKKYKLKDINLKKYSL